MREHIKLTRQGYFETFSTNVCLEPDKHYSEDPEVDCLHGEVTEKVSDLATLLRWWHTCVVLEEGVTLGDVFRALRGLDGIAVLSPLMTINLEKAFEQIEQEVTDPDPELRVREIRLWWNPFVSRVEEKENKPYIWWDDHPHCDGWGDWGFDPNAPADWPKEGGIGIEFTHLSLLKDIPIVLVEEFIPYYDNRDFGVPPGDMRYVFNGNREFRLGEFLYGICFELEVH